MRQAEQDVGARDDVATHPRLFRVEAARKALHLAAAVFPMAYWAGAPRLALILALGIVVGVAVAVELVRRRVSAVGTRFDRIFGAALRGNERSSLRRDGRAAITGATWLALALLGAVVLLSRTSAIAAMWCAAVGDPAAALVGVWWSSRRTLVAPRKSIAGSVACAAVSVAGLRLLASLSWPVALGIAVVATLAERFSAPIDDNIAIVVCVGLAASLV